MQISKFNIRVYGIVIHENKVLLTDEYRLGIKMTKFPGGGLEFGEGTHDCLRREFREEIDQEIKIGEHLYTTDYFQPTHLLNDIQQLLSIYFHVKPINPEAIKVTNIAFDFKELVDGVQSFRWIALTDLKPTDLTFPIDQKMVHIIQDRFEPK